jgi:hypothetical protein
MTTPVFPSENRLGSLLIRRFSRKLYVSAAVLIFLLIFVGFSRTYYLHRWFGMPDLSLFLHVHAFAMSLWIALFFIQTLLISVRQVRLHQNLGILGILSAALVPTLGVSATVMAARREVAMHTHNVSIAITVLALELTQMLMFSGFAAAGFILRNRTGYHKRLMLLATFCMLPNAIVRIVRMQSFIAPMIIWSLLIVIAALIDRWTHGRLHPVFGTWAFLQVALLWFALGVGLSDAWQHFAQRAVS